MSSSRHVLRIKRMSFLNMQRGISSSATRLRTSSTPPSNPFIARPGPHSLPPEDQKEFEELVRKAQAPLSTSPKTHVTSSKSDELLEAAVERHPDARKPIPAEFEGDVNPVTGERGGPKREPVKHNDWSYGGKVTDF